MQITSYEAIVENIYDTIYLITLLILLVGAIIFIFMYTCLYDSKKNKMQNDWLKEQTTETKAKILEYQQIKPTITLKEKKK